MNAYKSLVEKPEGKIHLIEQGVDRRILLKWVLGKYVPRVWFRFIRFRTGTAGRLL
jgi:hypothetical protein